MYKYMHKQGGGTGGRVIYCRHLWERFCKEEKLFKQKQRRVKQKATKRCGPTRYKSNAQRR